MPSPFSAIDTDYFLGHYSGLLAYAVYERLGWPLVYYTVPGERRWRSVTIQAPNGVEADARGILDRRGRDTDRRIATPEDLALLRSYYEKTTVRERIDAAAEVMAEYLNPGFDTATGVR